MLEIARPTCDHRWANLHLGDHYEIILSKAKDEKFFWNTWELKDVKIEGKNATANVDNGRPQGITIEFRKANGEWRIELAKMLLDS